MFFLVLIGSSWSFTSEFFKFWISTDLLLYSTICSLVYIRHLNWQVWTKYIQSPERKSTSICRRPLKFYFTYLLFPFLFASRNKWYNLHFTVEKPSPKWLWEVVCLRLPLGMVGKIQSHIGICDLKILSFEIFP